MDVYTIYAIIVVQCCSSFLRILRARPRRQQLLRDGRPCGAAGSAEVRLDPAGHRKRKRLAALHAVRLDRTKIGGIMDLFEFMWLDMQLF